MAGSDQQPTPLAVRHNTNHRGAYRFRRDPLAAAVMSIFVHMFHVERRRLLEFRS
jgi:hypothetical protein